MGMVNTQEIKLRIIYYISGSQTFQSKCPLIKYLTFYCMYLPASIRTKLGLKIVLGAKTLRTSVLLYHYTAFCCLAWNIKIFSSVSTVNYKRDHKAIKFLE